MKLRHLLLGRKAVTNIDSILRSRDVTLLTKICLVKAMVFSVVVYEYESWTVKRAESWRIDAFELWCWRRLLRVPWTARRSNQSIFRRSVLNIHWKEYSLKLKLQYLGHLMWRIDSLENTLMLGKIEDGRRRVWQRISWLDGITDLRDMILCKLPELVMEGRCGVLPATWGRRESNRTKRLKWTELKCLHIKWYIHL